MTSVIDTFYGVRALRPHRTLVDPTLFRGRASLPGFGPWVASEQFLKLPCAESVQHEGVPNEVVDISSCEGKGLLVVQIQRLSSFACSRWRGERCRMCEHTPPIRGSVYTDTEGVSGSVLGWSDTGDSSTSRQVLDVVQERLEFPSEGINIVFYLSFFQFSKRVVVIHTLP